MRDWRALVSALVFLLAVATVSAETVDRIVAVVNDEVITEADVARQVASILEEQVASTPTAAESLELHVMVLRNLIEQRLILQEAKKRGVTISSDDVNKRFDAMRARADSEEQFQRHLAESALTEEELRAKIREQLIVQQVIDAAVRSSITVTPLEVSRALGEHPEQARSGERARALHLLVRVTEDRLEGKARALIDDLHRQLAGGADFSALATRYSEDSSASDGGRMDWVAQGELLPELDQALFSLPVGSVSEPIQTRLGFHLLKVQERRAATELPVTEANQTVTRQLYQQKFEEAMKRWLDELKSRAYIQIL